MQKGLYRVWVCDAVTQCVAVVPCCILPRHPEWTLGVSRGESRDVTRDSLNVQLLLRQLPHHQIQIRKLLMALLKFKIPTPHP